MKNLLSTLLLLSLSFTTQSQTWQFVGSSTGISGTSVYTSVLDFNSNGVPYIAFSDNLNGGKTTVLSFDGSNWGAVGLVGISAGNANAQSISISPFGIPYVAYCDVANGNKTTVLSFNGVNWGVVGGEGVSTGLAFYQSMAINPSGVPYVAYQDVAYSNKTTVLSFNGSNWGVVGLVGISSGNASNQSLSFSSTGVPYVAYRDNANAGKITILSFNGSNWGAVGSEGVSTGSAVFPSLDISPSGFPIVSYQDGSNSGKTTVLSFNGSNWGTIGGISASSSSSGANSLAFNLSGVPYVAFHNFSNSSVNVLRFNGSSWEGVGDALGNSWGNTVCLKFNPVTNEPWVAYSNSSGYTFVLKFGKTAQQINGIFTTLNLPITTTSYSLSNVSATSGLPVIFASSNASIASISGNNIQIINAGVVTITAIQIGNNTFSGITTTGVLTINKLSQSITGFGTIADRNYLAPAFTLTGIGASSGLPVTLSIVTNPASGVASLSGNVVSILGTVGTVTITATQVGNATFLGTSLSQVFNVTTIAQQNQTITGFAAIGTQTYGGVPFGITATATSGLPVSFSLASTPASGVATITGTTVGILGSGTVTITATQVGNPFYFAAASVERTFAVNKANLSVTANNFTKTYGSINPTFTGSVLGIKNNDIIMPHFSCSATSLTGIGTYAIEVTATGANISNYELTVYNGVLTITKATLTVTANNFSRVYGSENPTFTGIALGIVNNDMITQTYSSTATSLTGIGTYDIQATATGANINNYQLITFNSVLTVTKANLTVTANNFSRVYGTENPTFTGIALGIVNNDIIDLSYTTSATETSNVGKYQINVTASGVNIYNYELKLNNGTLTINLAPSNATVTGASTIGPLISVTSITISGTGFVNGATVTVNSVLLSNFTIVDGTTIIATFPVGTLLASNNVILVQNPNQVASANTSITIENIQITTNLPTFQSSNINIYPNPSTGAFTIESPLPINEPIVIYNILGVAVQTISSKGENTIKISGLTTGMYLVQIGSFKQKVMVE